MKWWTIIVPLSSLQENVCQWMKQFFGQFRNLPNKKIEKGQKSSKKQTLRNKMTHLQNAFIVFFYFWSYLIAICTSSPRFLEVLYSGSGFAHDSSLFHVLFFREIICMNTSTMSCVGLIYKLHIYIYIYICHYIYITVSYTCTCIITLCRYCMSWVNCVFIAYA